MSKLFTFIMSTIAVASIYTGAECMVLTQSALSAHRAVAAQKIQNNRSPAVLK